jgi:signal transduction histidine kinase
MIDIDERSGNGATAPGTQRLAGGRLGVHRHACALFNGRADEFRVLRPFIAEGSEHRIDDFPPAQHDTPDRLLIPEKLYGRTREIETLLGAFERVVSSGTPELVLVSGYSGVGKSSVVNELQPVLVSPRALFASGKFDPYKRDIPYATLAQAFQSLIGRLLMKSEADQAPWRDALREALGPNGRLMIDLVPGLTHIIGEQPPVTDLPPRDARERFQTVLRRFISVFAQPSHPLALFLDDVQRLDGATLDLLDDLLTSSGVEYLLLIGAYRDNEVTAAHPLMLKLEAIRNAGARVQEVTLAPLAGKHVEQLVADALHCEPNRAAPLARLAYEKTVGNPFFLIQFLHTLAEEGCLAFDHEQARWSWDLERIQAQEHTALEGVAFVLDLTERRRAEDARTRAEAELQQARIALAHLQRVSMLGEVAASLAHEIRQPIAAALIDATVCLRALAGDRLDVQNAREAASRMVRDATWADEIIKRTTALYKKDTTLRERVKVNAVIREIALLLQQEASASSIAIRTELAEGIPDVIADRVQLQQVFMNLMLNAIDAMKDTGGDLTVTSNMSEDSELLIAVRDTGIGLPIDNPDHIFESFVTTKPNGTGMGLAITRSIVESHGGRLWAERNAGPGASFHFVLPIITGRVS